MLVLKGAEFEGKNVWDLKVEGRVRGVRDVKQVRVFGL